MPTLPYWVCRHIDYPAISFAATDAHVQRISRSPLATSTDDAVRYGSWVFVRNVNPEVK